MIPHAAWPVEPMVLGPFLVAVALVELTPGPNMIWLAALSAAHGRRAGLRAVAGVTLGLCIYMLASVAGVASVLATAPGAYTALRTAGVLYLLWLAIDAWRGADGMATGDPGAAPFWRGLLANLLNPKAAVFYVALLPGFIAPDHGSFAAQALVLGSAHIAVSIVVHTGLVIAAAQATRFLEAERRNGLRRALAVCIALVAVWLFWETRQ